MRAITQARALNGIRVLQLVAQTCYVVMLCRGLAVLAIMSNTARTERSQRREESSHRECERGQHSGTVQPPDDARQRIVRVSHGHGKIDASGGLGWLTRGVFKDDADQGEEVSLCDEDGLW